MEYSELLEQADNCQDPYMRLVYTGISLSLSLSLSLLHTHTWYVHNYTHADCKLAFLLYTFLQAFGC